MVGQSKRLQRGWMEQAIATTSQVTAFGDALLLRGMDMHWRNGGVRRGGWRVLLLTIGDGEPSILLLDFDFVPSVLALCVHRLVDFLLRGLHNLSFRLPLLGRGRAHISAACRQARRPAVHPVCAGAENNLLANTSLMSTTRLAMRAGTGMGDNCLCAWNVRLEIGTGIGLFSRCSRACARNQAVRWCGAWSVLRAAVSHITPRLASQRMSAPPAFTAHSLSLTPDELSLGNRAPGTGHVAALAAFALAGLEGLLN